MVLSLNKTLSSPDKKDVLISPHIWNWVIFISKQSNVYWTWLL